VTLADYKLLRDPLQKLMQEQGVKGTILLAEEGINGTIAGTFQAINTILEHFNEDPRLADIVYKESFSEKMPFKRCKVRLKKEIVTMGIAGINPIHTVGTYVSPQDWNDLIADPNVILIDTRNDYEVQIGTFKDAINPATDSFRQFPDYVKENLVGQRDKKIAMFCTGGIRCEKATAYLKEQGFPEVYHLQGGILKYLEEMPASDSTWQGECFVFDDRVTVNHDLEPGAYDQCYACRMPISDADKQSEHYEEHVSCPHCYDKTSPEKRASLLERAKQIALAKERGEIHIGSDVNKIVTKKQKSKYDTRHSANP
jgi:UPF0176 protein